MKLPFIDGSSLGIYQTVTAQPPESNGHPGCHVVLEETEREWAPCLQRVSNTSNATSSDQSAANQPFWRTSWPNNVPGYLFSRLSASVTKLTSSEAESLMIWPSTESVSVSVTCEGKNRYFRLECSAWFNWNKQLPLQACNMLTKVHPIL